MKKFFVYRNPSQLPSTIAVKKGFSWSAFIIGPFWFLVNKMWLTFILSMTFTYGGPMVLRLFENPENLGQALVSSLIVTIYFLIWFLSGSVANFLLGEELKRNGYILTSTVAAKNAGEAIEAVNREALNLSKI